MLISFVFVKAVTSKKSLGLMLTFNVICEYDELF